MSCHHLIQTVPINHIPKLSFSCPTMRSSLDKRFLPVFRSMDGLVQLRPNVDGRSSDDRSSIHVPLFDRCPTLESKRGNLGIVAGSPPHVVAGRHRGG